MGMQSTAASLLLLTPRLSAAPSLPPVSPVVVLETLYTHTSTHVHARLLFT